jgi:hypothetical protein
LKSGEKPVFLFTLHRTILTSNVWNSPTLSILQLSATPTGGSVQFSSHTMYLILVSVSPPSLNFLSFINVLPRKSHYNLRFIPGFFVYILFLRLILSRRASNSQSSFLCLPTTWDDRHVPPCSALSLLLMLT